METALSARNDRQVIMSKLRTAIVGSLSQIFNPQLLSCIL